MRLFVLLRLALLTTIGAVIFTTSDTSSFSRACDMPTHPDYAPLMALYNATDGPNWNNNTGWGEDCDVCRWRGITCKDERVIKIKLNSNRLNGELPDALVGLDSLEILEASANRISGTFPNNYSQFVKLRRVTLFANRLSGNLSQLLTNGKLDTLILSNNRFTGGFPSEIIEMGDSLLSLGLGWNRLTGEIPSDISKLGELNFLDLSRNFFQGQFPSTIYNMTNLRYLYLHENGNLIGSLSASLANLNNLVELNLSSTKIAGEIPEQISNLQSLRYLSFRKNSISGRIPEELYEIETLNFLDLSWTNLVDGLSESIGDLSNLRELRIANTNLGGNLPSRLGTISNMLRLDLSNSNFTGSLPLTFEGFQKIEELRLNNNFLEGDYPPYIGLYPRIRTLRLASNLFTGCIPETYSNLCGLSFFSLSGNCTFENPIFSQFCDGAPCNNTLNLSASSIEPCAGEMLTIEPGSNYSEYEWSVNGENTRQLSTEATQSQYYYLTVTNSRGCTKTDSIFINVTSSEAGAEEASICPGQVVTINGEDFNETGTFNQPIPRPGLCDSTVIVTILAAEGTSGTYQETVCANQSTFINGDEFFAGTHSQTITNQAGCDSTISITIDEFPVYSENFEYTVCEGETYDFEGMELEAGPHTFPLKSIQGCDSIINVQINTNPITTGFLETTFCEGDSVQVNGEYFKVPDTYIRTLTNSNNCDSTLTISVTEIPSARETIHLSFCAGTEITVNDENYDRPDTFYQNLSASNGCDSVLTIVLSEIQSNTTFLNEIICDGQAYFVEDQPFNTPGPHTIPLTNATGCDSTVVLSLTIISGEDQVINASTCQGTPYVFGDEEYNEAITIQDSIVINGCRSLVTLNLEVIEPVYDRYDQFICENQSIFFYGEFYNTTGEYSETLTSSNGCDSIIVMNLTVGKNQELTIDTSICRGAQIVIGNKAFEEAGEYVIPEKTALGCDSTILLNIDLYDLPIESYEEVVCEGSEIEFIDGEFYGAGEYLGSYKIGNCVQNFELLVTEVQQVVRDELLEICSGSTANFMDVTYDHGGVFPIDIQVDDCEQIENVIVLQSSSLDVILPQVFCVGTDIRINGQLINESGTYQSLGSECSAEIINILFIAGEDLSITDTIESGTAYVFGDGIFTEAGTYEILLGEDSDCPSLLTLILHVETCGAIREETITLCDGESYAFYDQSITASGLYEHRKQLSVGCDSLIQLSAVVNEAIDFSVVGQEYICDGSEIVLSGPAGYEYLWSDGSTSQEITIDRGGDYNLTIFDADNCASYANVAVEEIVFPAESIDINTSKPSTCTSVDGSIQIVFDSSEDYLYSVDGGLTFQESNLFQNLGNGNYAIAIADNKNRCVKSIAESVILESTGVPEIDEVNISQINDCLGLPGSIEIIPDNLDQTYIYSIDGGITWSESGLFDNLEGGIYNVQMKVDGADCINNRFSNIDIENTANLEAEVKVGRPLRCDGAKDGLLEVTILDGLGPYEFEWSNGAIDAALDGLSAGVYTLTVTDANGCVEIIEQVLEGIEVEDLLVSFVDTVICTDQVLTYPVDENFNYILFKENQFYTEGATVEVSEPGDYQVIIENGEDCISDQSFTVTKLDLTDLGIDFLLATEGVAGVEVVSINVSDPMPDNFSFEVADSSVTSVEVDQFSKGYTFKSAGTYTVSLQTEINGCLANIDKEIVIYPDSSFLGTYEEPETERNLDQFGDWKILPNPNNGQFLVEVNVISGRYPVSVSVYDIFGALIVSESFIAQETTLQPFNLYSSGTGIYTVVLRAYSLEDSKQILIFK